MTVPGIPNRARVSASGQVLSWTTFTTGDSYNTAAFSTRTAILDLRTGYLVKSIEQIPLTFGGARHHDSDVNYWGVTFAADDNRFYATVSTRGATHLVEGDLRAWSAKALRENAECPSLSPDGTRVAFKKKVSDDPGAPGGCTSSTWRRCANTRRPSRTASTTRPRGWTTRPSPTPCRAGTAVRATSGRPRRTARASPASSSRAARPPRTSARPSLPDTGGDGPDTR